MSAQGPLVLVLGLKGLGPGLDNFSNHDLNASVPANETILGSHNIQIVTNETPVLTSQLKEAINHPILVSCVQSPQCQPLQHVHTAIIYIVKLRIGTILVSAYRLQTAAEWLTLTRPIE